MMHTSWSKHGIGASGEGQFVYPQTEFVECQSMAWMGMIDRRRGGHGSRAVFRDCDYLCAVINNIIITSLRCEEGY
jgi:hypothetical protein